MKLSSRKLAQAWRSVPSGSPLPAHVGEPLAVLRRGFGAGPLDVAHHGVAERIRVEPGAALVEAPLRDDVAGGMQRLQERRVVDLPGLVQPGHDALVDPGGAALVHHLGLRLRIEILRDQPHDADDLPLPEVQLGRGLLDEVEQVLLGQPEMAAALADRVLDGGGLLAGHGAPEVVVDLLVVVPPLGLALAVLLQVQRARAAVPVHAMARQGVRRVQHALHRRDAIAVLAPAHVFPRELQVVDDGGGFRPLPEQVVVAEEMVVAERRVRDHQRLHRRRVLLHQVADAGVGVDHHLVGQAGVAAGGSCSRAAGSACRRTSGGRSAACRARCRRPASAPT